MPIVAVGETAASAAQSCVICSKAGGDFICAVERLSQDRIQIKFPGVVKQKISVGSCEISDRQFCGVCDLVAARKASLSPGKKGERWALLESQGIDIDFYSSKTGLAMEFYCLKALSSEKSHLISVRFTWEELAPLLGLLILEESRERQDVPVFGL